MLSVFGRLFPSESIEEVMESKFGMLVCEALDSVLMDEADGNELPKKGAMFLPFIKIFFSKICYILSKLTDY